MFHNRNNGHIMHILTYYVKYMICTIHSYILYTYGSNLSDLDLNWVSVVYAEK